MLRFTRLHSRCEGFRLTEPIASRWTARTGSGGSRRKAGGVARARASRPTLPHGLTVGLGWLILLGGGACSRISVSPSCPSELAGGETGPVTANARDAGAIATFRWEVIPPEAGRFAEPGAADTTFEAIQSGEALIRLTASDGFFQVISECLTIVTSTSPSAPPPAPPPTTSSVAVSLSVRPSPIVLGEEVTVVCASVGGVEAVAFTVGQLEGRPVTLTAVSEGVATFIPEEDGELTFRCIGQTADGEQSAPIDTTITVPSSSDDGGADGPRGGRG